MRNAWWRRLLVALVAVALATAACGGDDDGGEDGGTTAQTGGDATGETAGGATGETAAGGTAITIEGFAFAPTSLQVSGETTLTITNDDSAAHTFTLDDGSVDEEVAAGESIEVTVDVSESTGFHCEFHPQMTGTLEVA
jgi:plastocyanin